MHARHAAAGLGGLWPDSIVYCLRMRLVGHWRQPSQQAGSAVDSIFFIVGCHSAGGKRWEDGT